VNDPRSRRISAYVALAKLQEHHERNAAAALATIQAAHALLVRGLIRPGPAHAETSREALEHRMARLKKKSA